MMYTDFVNLNYVVQEPNRDKTYYFVKQNIGETRQIFVKLFGKNQSKAEVEVLSNYKKAELTKKELTALENLFSDLGVTEYSFN